MRLGLSTIAAPAGNIRLHALRSLGPAHGLTRSDLRMLEKFFGLHSVALDPRNQRQMSQAALRSMVEHAPWLTTSRGRILHVKTQTHNTFPDSLWLAEAASDAGLQDWETVTLSMNHCAGALSALHLLRNLAHEGPAILLAGEKCFHPATARQPGAALGELPVAALFTSQAAWQVAQSWVLHAPAFHDNPDRMSPALQRAFSQNFGGMLRQFVTDCLNDAGLSPDAVDLVVPYHLNLPILRDIAEDHGWQDKIALNAAARVGHLFCADVLVNLGLTLPRARGRTVLCIAAGMGATFSAALLRKGPGSPFRASSFVFEAAETGQSLHIQPIEAKETAA